MSASALVGFTGFVGSNLAAQHPFESTYNSRNIGDIAGRTFELLVFAGAGSKKWWANEHPIEDWVSIQKAIDPLAAVRAHQAVLISTIDVIPATESAKGELANCDIGETSAYGRNRRRLEELFVRQFASSLVVRLPALFGRGLKKNVIYDLMHDHMLEKINPASSFQYYDVARLWSDVTVALKAGVDLVHLFPEPIATHTIVKNFFSCKVIGRDASPVAHYDYRTRHGDLFGGTNAYVEQSGTVLTRLRAFISAELNGEIR